MGLLDSVKGLFGGKKSGGAKAPKKQLQGLAKKADDQAEKLAKKDGVVGDVAAKAHEALDKVDGD
jgi:hypothetical protein